MTTENVRLADFRRGTEFAYSASLTSGWTVGTFTGGILFTLRRGDPVPSSVEDDAGALHQASVANGQIVFANDTDFTVTIPASFTNTWPAERLHWDMQGKITTGGRILDIAAGMVRVVPDVTRTI